MSSWSVIKASREHRSYNTREKIHQERQPTSAVRWAAMLRELGHRVEIATDSSVLSRRPIDLMVALHAWRSHAAVEAYRQQYPDGPLIVALGGTDVNTYLTSHPAQTLKSMNAADALVCLHDLVGARFA